MKKFAFGLTIAAVLALGSGGTAAAGPTCSDTLGVENHGQHVVRDYVTNGSATDWPPSDGQVGENSDGAGGDPAHRGSGVQPGASFCIEQSQSRPLP